jgi:signal transduction histidine kinase
VRRLLPDTLAGRTIVILVIGLGLFHLWSIWIYQMGSQNVLGLARERELAEHLLGAWRALEELPPDQRDSTAHALSSPGVEIHWSPMSPMLERRDDHKAITALRQSLGQLNPAMTDERMRFDYADDAATRRHLLMVGLQVADGSWVTFALSSFGQGAISEHDVVGSLTAMALGILVVSVLLVRSLTAPLRALAGAADRIGTDISAAGAPETGPRELRLVARAFNTMQGRIRRLITDRTRTLAAVSHDLKTPLTRLRLRAEFVGDRELREMIDADLDEMERMLEQTLAFLRGDSAEEESKTVDIASILKTVCDQAADAGQDVLMSDSERTPLRCRPLAIKRALSNLIDNAIKYGRQARVQLTSTPQEVIVSIEDDGPGIPEDERERVFDPFYRVETSRSRETGGTGLGLTLARSTVRAHGGEIRLDSRKGGGLRVMVTLPKPTGR